MPDWKSELIESFAKAEPEMLPGGTSVTSASIKGPVNFDVVYALSGRVNAAEIMGIPPGHVLFFGASYERGDRFMLLNFVRRSHPWNCFPDPEGGRFTPIDANGEELYPAADFDAAFADPERN